MGKEDYDSRFTEEDILFLRRADVPPEIANRFKRMGGYHIKEFFLTYASGIPGSESSDWFPQDIISTLDQYPVEFGPHAIDLAFREGITPQMIEEYGAPMVFDDFSTLRFILGGVSLEQAIKWWNHFEYQGEGIVRAIKTGRSLEEVLEYPTKFYGAKESAILIENGISASTAWQYTDRWSHVELQEEHKGTGWAEHNSYFRHDDIIFLERSGIPIEEIWQYDMVFYENLEHTKFFGGTYTDGRTSFGMIHGKVIKLLHTSGITAEHFKQSMDKSFRFKLAFFAAYKWLEEYRWLEDDSGIGFLVGTGEEALVFFDTEKKTARKFTAMASREYQNYRLLDDARNVVGVKPKEAFDDLGPAFTESFFESEQFRMESPITSLEAINFEMEYIEGSTLEGRVSAGLNVEEVLKYSKDIANGILEMRMVNLYHRDLHLGNIMIDEEDDRAVLIDLGIAIGDPEKINPHNRAYGGNNDLISLGQLMYKLATGRNLFNPSGEPTAYSHAKDATKECREKTYDNPRLKHEMLCKIHRDVSPPTLADIIVHLLDDNLWVQPGYERVEEARAMFEDIYPKGL